MRRRRLLAILTACIVIGIGAWVFWPKPQEPKYQGRTLSEWLRLYERRSTGELSAKEIDAAPDALRHIGTNALPYLMKWIQPSLTPTGAELAVQRLPEGLRESFLFKRFDWRGEALAQAAIVDFGILGPEARTTIPQLVVLATSGSPNPYACEALVLLGQDGLAGILDALADPRQPNRESILRWIGWQSNARVVVPLLIRYMDDPDPGVAMESARALGRRGVGQESALKALIKGLHHPDASVRGAAATALADWHTAAQPALSSLLRDLKDPRYASAAAGALGDLQLEPRTVVPGLARSLLNPDPIVKVAAARGLGKFGFEARSAVPTLFELYNDPDEYVRQTAKEAISSTGPMSFPFPEGEMFRRRYGLPFPGAKP